MKVTRKPELEEFIAAEVRAGRSADPGEFLNRAVYHYVVARDLGQEITPEEIDKLIAEDLAARGRSKSDLHKEIEGNFRGCQASNRRRIASQKGCYESHFL